MSLQRFKHFQIEELLGRGGMGEVYLAHDVNLERKVALKFLPRELLRDPSAQGRLLDEARSISRVQHPNIAVIHSIEEDAGVFALCMEYIEGQSLKQMLRSGVLPISRIIHLATQVAAGMQAAHEAGIVHRDLKPANVMVTRGGEAKVMDFGLALRPRRVVDTVGSSTYGTVQYMSPEQARGESLDPRTDIFSFGSTLYEVTTGRPPFEGKNDLAILQAILHDEPARLRDVRREVPPAFEQLVRGCMAKPVGARWDSMATVLDELHYLGPLAEAGPRDLISELSTGLSGQDQDEHKPRNHGAVGRRPRRSGAKAGPDGPPTTEDPAVPEGLELPEGVVVHRVVDRGDVEYGPSGSVRSVGRDSKTSTDGLDIQTTSEQWDEIASTSFDGPPIESAAADEASPSTRADGLFLGSDLEAEKEAVDTTRDVGPRPTESEQKLFLGPAARRSGSRGPRQRPSVPTKSSRWSLVLPLVAALLLTVVGAWAILRVAGVPLPGPQDPALQETAAESPANSTGSEGTGAETPPPARETTPPPRAPVAQQLQSADLTSLLGPPPIPELPRPPLPRVRTEDDTAPR